MNRKIVSICLLFIFAVVAAFGFLILKPDTKPSQQVVVQKSDASKDEDTKSVPAQTAQQEPGRYVDYADGIIGTTSGTKILFFHAPWCPQCRALETDIKASEIPSGVTIIKVDYDTAQTLRKQYGVTLQTTIVRVNDDGTLNKKFVAYDDPTLDAIKTNLL